MNCDAIIEDLQAFLDNELQTTRRSEVELHLKACNECNQMVSDLGNLSNLLRSCDIPTPNLPTGQQILAKTGFKPVTANPFSQFIHSVYDFLFKYKAPVLATVSMVAIVAVVININGVKELTFDGFSSKAPTSPTIAVQEKVLSEELKNAPQSALQEADANNITSKDANSLTQTSPKTLSEAKPAGVASSADSSNLNMEKAKENVMGGIVGGRVEGTSESLTIQPSTLAVPPLEFVESQKPAKREDILQPKYELEKDAVGRAITLDKNTMAKAGKAIDAPNQPSPANEEIMADKMRDNKVTQPKDITTSEIAKGKPAEVSANKTEKKLDDISLADSRDEDREPAKATKSKVQPSRSDNQDPARVQPSLTPRISPSSKPGLSAQSSASAMGNSTAGTMSQRPAIPRPMIEVETKKLVIKSAQMSIETTELNPTKERLNQVVKEQQGSISLTQAEQNIKITIRVPVAKFESTLAELRKLGKVTQEKTNEKNISLDDLEQKTEDSKKADSKEENSKRSGENDQLETRRRQKQIEANTAVINLVIQIKDSK